MERGFSEWRQMNVLWLNECMYVIKSKLNKKSGILPPNLYKKNTYICRYQSICLLPFKIDLQKDLATIFCLSVSQTLICLLVNIMQIPIPVVWC
jgi:hypothetical protein